MADMNSASRRKPRHPDAPPSSVGTNALQDGAVTVSKIDSAFDATIVHRTGDETVAGVKTFTGRGNFRQGATTGATTAYKFVPGENTAVPTVTEAKGIMLDVSQLKTWVAGVGPLGVQREIHVTIPQYAGTAGTPLTITNAAAVYIEGAPVGVGGNITIMNSYAFMVASGATLLNGAVELGSTLALGGEVTCGSNDILGIGIASAQVVRAAVDNISIRPAAAGGIVTITKADGVTKAFESSAVGCSVNGAPPAARANAVTNPTVVAAAFNQVELETLRTAINEIRTALTNFGITL